MKIRSAEGKLIALECDYCSKRVLAGPDITESGWMKHGLARGNKNVETIDTCPQHNLDGIEYVYKKERSFNEANGYRKTP